jgi:4-deoxy-L-threo-5-hexosulose-uronate ketol-isomerase
MVTCSSLTAGGWPVDSLTELKVFMRYSPNADHAKTLTTEELRAHFLVTDLFLPGAITLRHTDLDRVVLGGAVPTDGPLKLEAPDSMKAEYFTERRELGVLNIGGSGKVTVDKDAWPMSTRDVLYVGRGSREILFESNSSANPARYYLVSYPAHASHPTTLITPAATHQSELGSAERANRRRIYRYIHADGVKSAQLVMGVTVLESGSVWNTMPAHTHERRTEVYLYFDVPADSIVLHLMGEPTEMRTLVVRDGEVALSPGWSVHAGCGTSSYAFCWAMGGENQDFADMQPVEMTTLR